jgi:hypothetical protein
MRIDNSRAKAFFNCPAYFYERYVQDIEASSRDNFAFGTRWHQLLEERYRRQKGEDFTAPPCDNEEVENEARTMLARYEAHYPEEPFDVVAVEQYFEIGLPEIGDPVHLECDCGWGVTYDGKYPVDVLHCPECGAAVKRWYRHTYCGEMDAIVRDKATGLLQLFETKSEKRGSKANLPDAWAARSQVGLYLWAAEEIYKEPFKNILLNVCTRQSPKGQEPASFRRDDLQRSEKEKADAVSNIIYIADQIKKLEQTHGRDQLWPQNRNVCVNEMTGWKCDYHLLHVVGRGERDEQLIQIKYKPATEYLAF